MFFRLTKTLKERESWFEKQLQKKIGNYSKRSKFFRMSAVYFLGILVLICTFVQILSRGLATGRRNTVVLVSMVGRTKRPPRATTRRKG